MPGKSSFQQRVWDPFWKGYLVWMNRLIVACSNTYFFSTIAGLFSSVWLANAAIFAYSVLLCEVLHRFVLGGRNAAYQDRQRPASPDDEDRAFNMAAERTLKETFLAYLVNIALGLLVCYYFHRDFVPIAYGAIGLVFALFTPFGAGMMAATNVRTGRPDPALVTLGLAAIVPGVVYVIVTLT